MMDKISIGLSFGCLLHCLLLPVLLIALPAFKIFPFDDEIFHIAMVIAVLPISLYALSVGCQQHKHQRLFFIGLIGISCLILALTLESILGESGEKILTTVGAIMVAWAHWQNYRYCDHD